MNDFYGDIMAGSTQRDQADLYLDQITAFGIADVAPKSAAPRSHTCPINFGKVIKYAAIGGAIFIAAKRFKLI